jgi:hypothetical protein
VTWDDHIDVAPDLSSIVATSADGRSLTIWDSKTLRPLRTLAAPPGTSFVEQWLHPECPYQKQPQKGD